MRACVDIGCCSTCMPALLFSPHPYMCARVDFAAFLYVCMRYYLLPPNMCAHVDVLLHLCMRACVDLAFSTHAPAQTYNMFCFLLVMTSCMRAHQFSLSFFSLFACSCNNILGPFVRGYYRHGAHVRVKWTGPL